MTQKAIVKGGAGEHPRIIKLHRLASEHHWYSRLAMRLTEAEFDKVVEILEDTADLDNDQYTLHVNRLWIQAEGRPRHSSAMVDLLLACRIRGEA